MAVFWRRKLAICPFLLLFGCSDLAADCDDAEIVRIASEMVEEQIAQAFGLASLFNQKKVTADVTLDQFREYRKYDDAIGKRFCEASSLTKIRDLGELLQMGMALNGIEPSQLEQGIRGNIKYSVQLTNDGTHLVSIEQ